MDSIEKMMEQSEIGFAKNQMIYDESGKPVDYYFLAVNPSFERLMGLKREELLNRRVSEVIPKNIDDAFDWIGFYGKVVVEGKKRVFEQYSAPLDKWYRVEAFSSEKDSFTTLFTDISHGRELAEASKNFLNDRQEEFEKQKDLLKQRNKEISCMFKMSEIVQKKVQLLEVMLQQFVDIIPPAFHYTEMTCARITYKGEQYNSESFKETPYKLSSDILFHGKKAGSIEVFLLKQTHEDNAAPFLESEKSLIDSLSERIGRIAERKASELKLLESKEEEFRRKTKALNESHRMAKMGRWDYYHKKDILQFTEGVFNILELAPGKFEANYQGYLKKIHPDDRKEAAQEWEEALDNHRPYNTEYRLLLTNGRVKWIASHCYTEYDEDGHPYHSVGIVQDITEQKGLEIDLRKSEEKFRNLFQKHLVVQIIIDAETGYLLDANDAATKFYGWTRAELKQMKIFQINTLSSEEIRIEMEKARRQKRNYFLFKHRLASGEVRDVEVFSTQIEVDGKEVLHSIIRDITEKKANERELLKAKHQAEEANKAKSIFLANMNHELRTPLNGIIGFSDLLRSMPLDEEQKEFVDIVYTSAKHLASIISDILDFSRIEAGKFELNAKKTELKPLIENTLSMVRPKAKMKGLDLCPSIENDVPRIVEVDSSRLRQVLINLVGNAVKFTDEGTVSVSVSLQEQQKDKVRLLFKVTDTGIGIKKEEQAKIFEAFQQANMSTDKKALGTGLGLTISKNILELMGGTLTLESEYSKGSTFSFELLLPYEVDDTIASEEAEFENTDESSSFINKKVLIAEDNPQNMQYAQKAIALLSKDIHVIKAKNGKEAYHLYSEHQPDLILMDIIMPEVDGYQATAMIRAYNEQVPIIALTAKASSEDREDCLKAGMNDFITKPVTLEQLKETVEKYLD